MSNAKQIELAAYYNALALYYGNMAMLVLSKIGDKVLDGPPKDKPKANAWPFDFEKRN